MLKNFFSTTSLKANIIANISGTAFTALISIIFVPFYLKYIGAEGYGLIGIFASVQTVLYLLDSGLSTTLNREIARLIVLPNTQLKIQNLVKTLGSIYWIMALFAGIIAMCISPIIAKYWLHPKILSTETISNVFFLLSASIVFQFPIGFYSGGLLGLQRQVLLNFNRIIFATLKSVVALLILMFITKSIIVFFAWSLFVSILQSITMKYLLWSNLPKTDERPIFEFQEVKRVWRFASGMLGISLTAILLTQIDKVILSKILNLSEFGYYSISCTLGLVVYQIIGPINQSFFPKFSNLISLKDLNKLKLTYHQACQITTIFVIPPTLFLIFFSKDLIFLWTHNLVTVENTWLVTAIYAYGTGMNGLMNIPYMITLSFGWTKLGFYQNIIFLILMIPLTIYMAFKYGAIGGALSWSIINTLYFIITPSIIHKKILKGELYKWYWNDTLKPLLACLLFFLIVKKFIIFNDKTFFITILYFFIIWVTAVFFSTLVADKLRPILFFTLNNIKNGYRNK